MSKPSLDDSYAADTMAIVLHLENRRSSKRVTEIFQAASRGNLNIHIPAIVFAEILYLSEKRRISVSLSDVEDHVSMNANFHEAPLSLEVIRQAAQITDIPELHDRLIASTASVLGLKLITNDAKIQNSQFIDTIW